MFWNYGRGGWASAGAGYRFFLPFEAAGTGRFTSMALGVAVAISVNAEGDMNEADETAVFKVTYSFTKLFVYGPDGENVEREGELE